MMQKLFFEVFFAEKRFQAKGLYAGVQPRQCRCETCLRKEGNLGKRKRDGHGLMGHHVGRGGIRSASEGRGGRSEERGGYGRTG
jgi:hypothetical protein